MRLRLTRRRDRVRVVLLEGIHERAVEVFRERGYTEIRHEPGALSDGALVEAIREAHLLGIRSRTHVTADVIQTTQRLMAVGCFCIGTDQVDLLAAAHWGVPVFNAPHSNTRSVAEMVIGLSVMLFRDVFRKSNLAHEGAWEKSAEGAHELRGRTIGIVGYGHIGSQVSVLAESLGMRVIFHDVRPVLAHGNARRAKGLAGLLKEADLVTLHVPDTPQTRNMIDAESLAAMRPGGLLINTSRGSVVDVEALAIALREGRLAGAAVDVFPREPERRGESFDSPLRGLPNVILTPHVAGSTLQAQENIAVDVATKLIAYGESGATVGAVNFPELDLAPHRACHRVLHIHRNEPGVIAAMNDLLAEQGANVLGQHLQTQNDVGYVVTDVDSIDAKATLPKLRALPHTLRARILY
jgi:D-3-phosphoglycerate dehydrogenase